MKHIAILRGKKKIGVQVAMSIKEVNRIVAYCKSKGYTTIVYNKGV